MTKRPPEDLFHVPRNEEYLLQLRAEQAFWDRRVETPLSRTPAPAVTRYYNERLSGDANRRWYETVSDYREFHRGGVLGAGPGHVERHLLTTHPGLCLTIFDVSSGALERLQSKLDSEFPGRAETRQEDLNFAKLPAESYDLLVADSSIHHMVNLEHVAFEANRSLTSDGYFFMHDTVGESRFQSSEEKRRLFETVVEATDGRRTPASRIRWPDPDNWTFSPFESVRSGEILDVFGRYLQVVRLRAAGALLALSLFVETGAQDGHRSGTASSLRRARAALLRRLRRSRPDVRDGKARLDLLLMLDRILSETGYLEPGLAFAVYRKRT